MARSYNQDLPFESDFVDFAELSREELQVKIVELLSLVETSRELLRAKDADDVARRVLLSVIGVLGASSASVLRRDPERERMELLHQFGLDLGDSLVVPLPDAVAEALVTSGPLEPFAVNGDAVPRAARSFLRSYADLLSRLEADIVCPLVGRRGLFGFLILGQRLLPEGYARRDLELFASLAELYVLALERSAALTAPHASRPALATREVQAALRELRSQHPPLQHILGESGAMLRLFTDLVEISNSRATVLIQGESGTGKELVAHAIHALSPRREGPFEVMDCSSIPKELIESELFGHVRGAFTGAVRDRRGAFDLAHGGTLFLDEIGDMPLPSQTRLLRVLQEGRFRPVGGEKTHSVDVRVIAATNVDLREAVSRGEFRKDLFYRIQVFPLRLPALRERRGDIRVLTHSFLERFYREDGRPAPEIEPGVFSILENHTFPGNIRELQNIVEALAIRSRAVGKVTGDLLRQVFHSQHLSTEPGTTPQGGGFEPPGPAVSSRLTPGQQVLEAWQQTGFNLMEASRQLRARRMEGESVAVVDRAQLSHYLDGEMLKAFAETESLEAAVEQLSAGGNNRRVATRTRRVLAHLADCLERGRPEEAFPRLPEEYHPYLQQATRQGAEWIAQGLRS